MAAISYATGPVTVQIPGGAPMPAHIGLELPQGATVCTSANAFATVRLASEPGEGAHDDLNLLSSTCATVSAFTALGGGRQSRVSVETGAVSVRDSDSPGQVVVETPSAVTTGSGGGFRVALEADGSRSEAIHGDLSVIGAGLALAVPEGYGSRVLTGQAPQAPTLLLLPGAPIRPDEGANLLRPDFTWTAMERALGYRVEVSASEDFSEMILVEEVSAAAWRPPVLLLPSVDLLWWRVATFDRTGFLGKESAPRHFQVPRVGP